MLNAVISCQIIKLYILVKETYGRMSNAQKTDGTGGSELRNMLEGTEHGKRRKSGTYNAGVKDLASA